LIVAGFFVGGTFPSLRGCDGRFFVGVGVRVRGGEVFGEGPFTLLGCRGAGVCSGGFAFAPEGGFVGGVEGRPEFAGVEGEV
jgi:hypothetical protein